MSGSARGKQEKVPANARMQPPERHNLRSRGEMVFPVWSHTPEREGLLLPVDRKAERKPRS